MNKNLVEEVEFEEDTEQYEYVEVVYSQVSCIKALLLILFGMCIGVTLGFGLCYGELSKFTQRVLENKDRTVITFPSEKEYSSISIETELKH